MASISVTLFVCLLLLCSSDSDCDSLCCYLNFNVLSIFVEVVAKTATFGSSEQQDAAAGAHNPHYPAPGAGRQGAHRASLHLGPLFSGLFFSVFFLSPEFFGARLLTFA